MSHTTQAQLDSLAITCAIWLCCYLLLLEVLAFKHAHIPSGSHPAVVEWYHWRTAVQSLLHWAASAHLDLVASGLHVHSIDSYLLIHTEIFCNRKMPETVSDCCTIR
ncbi:uncharacterized protein LAESUDRAFT_754305 [Laetiporus sulphureus 93-53]|uniref:Uncharacterized protein n=1 Tax=Laetiporus sulphureus 93-53 TaxID=1314785 RepID=A0A165HHP4_9APHY|nr:uncharacterized protein LAESUDRAFT_754305 [Laetiporus sulphureus 93-53]KZT11746.1 hypothetical protein LAESUDRAFT_754305 [Laetiporus sulphureus 93-53]